MKPRFKVIIDCSADFNNLISKLKNQNVLVGIPENKTERKDKDGVINNATIMAINHFGSEKNNIPPRQPIAIGIKNAQSEIIGIFKKIGSYALKQNQNIDVYFERVGIKASMAIKKAINSQDGILPPSESTLKARRRKGFKGDKALLVTGQLRNSITYVVKK